MPRSVSSSDAERILAAIPIGVFIISDAGTASSSPFHRAPKIVHDHPGIVFTSAWNTRSRCAGNRDHDEPQYAGNQVLCNPTWIGIKRDLLDDALVPLNVDLDQNNNPEVAQRGRHLDV
jgi:hypothetical protein